MTAAALEAPSDSATSRTKTRVVTDDGALIVEHRSVRQQTLIVASLLTEALSSFGF